RSEPVTPRRVGPPVRFGVRTIDTGLVPAVLHLGPCLAVGGRRPGPAGRVRRAYAAAARRRTVGVRGRGLVAAPGLRPGQAGRDVRPCQGRRLQRETAWPVPRWSLRSALTKPRR